MTSSERIRQVAKLVAANKGKGDIVVLSSINGSRKALTEIADYLYKKNVDGAKELLNILELQYNKLVDDLFVDPLKNAKIKKVVESVATEIREISKDLFTKYEEKIIVAQGELLISEIFVAYLETIGVQAKHLNFIKKFLLTAVFTTI